MELTRTVCSRFVCPRQTSLIAPAVRGLVLAAGQVRYEPDGDLVIEVDFLPVLTIQATTFEVYSNPLGGDAPDPPTSMSRKQLGREGWELSHALVEHEPIVANSTTPVFTDSPRGSALRSMSELLEEDGGYLAASFVSCPWGPEEDEGRLAGLVEDLKAEASRIAERKAAASAARAAA